MKNVSDNDLILLYYGEHEDPRLAARVAESDELSRRFAALSVELELADAWQPPPRGDDYGAAIWQRISPRLEPADQPRSALGAWLASLAQPRFSLAGVLGAVLVAAVAFMLGRNEVAGPGTESPGAAAVPPSLAVNIDPQRLLARSVADHLEEVDRVLTQFANSSETSALEAEWATDMLVANRLYRQAAAARGDRQLAVFLTDLEPLLIELAYEARTATPASRERMQEEIRDGLLFRVRIYNEQLRVSGIST